MIVTCGLAKSNELNKPWQDSSKALVLDAYEANSLEWMKIIQDKRIAGFIGKASDGLSPKYCSSKGGALCYDKWRRYSITKELYHTRRQFAKSLGLKWGAYHLARPNNPIKQAYHFLKYAAPTPDEVVVLDIETTDTKKYMSLEDAEVFASYLKKRIGRYPMLYTNHSTAKHIADNKEKYLILSRLKLWYARYKPSITNSFPMGHWQKPTLWQFAYGGNCKGNSCPYKVNGTPKDIDVNVTTLNVKQMRASWPFDGLVTPIIQDELEPKGVASNDVVVESKGKDKNTTTSNAEVGLVEAPSACSSLGYSSGPDGLESC